MNITNYSKNILNYLKKLEQNLPEQVKELVQKDLKNIIKQLKDQFYSKKNKERKINKEDLKLFLIDLYKRKYRIIKLIKTGGEGIVFKGKQIDKNQKVAIKLCLFNNEDEIKDKQEREKEIIDSIVCHKYIVKTFNQFRIKNSFMIVQIMEYCKCDLYDEIKKNKDKFTLYIIINIFFQLINSLIEIHTKNIIHFDIKPQNILKTSKKEYKLTDFGISNMLSIDESNCNQINGMTKLYSSPEQYDKYNQKKNKIDQTILIEYTSDIFSMGLTFLSILGVSLEKKVQLQNTIEKVSIAQAIRKGQWPEQIQNDIKKEYLTLLSFVRNYMLNIDPSKRKRAIELKKIFIRYYNGKNMELNEERERINSLINKIKLKKFKYNKNNLDGKYIKCIQYEAYLYCLLGQIEQNPKKYFKKAFDVAQTIQGFSKQDLLYFQNEYGIALLNSLKFKYAKSNLFKCFEQRKKEKLDVFESITSLSLYYENIGDFNQVLNYNLIAYYIKKQKCDENHPEYAESLNRVGYSYSLLDKFEEGQQYLHKSLKLRKKIFTGDHPDIAESYKSIAQIYYKIGDYENSKKYYNLALQMLKSIYGEKNQYTADIFYELGIIYGKLNIHKVSLENFQKCLEIRRSIFKEKHPSIAQSYSSMFYTISIAHENLDDRYLDETLMYYLESYYIRKQILPKNHPDIAESINNIGVAFMRKKDFNRALQFFDIALKMRKDLYPEVHLFIAHTLNNIGFCNGQLKCKEISQKYQFKSLEIRKKLYKDDHLEIAQVYRSIAKVYFINNDYQNSIKFNIQCLEMRKRLRQYEDPQNENILKQISDAYQLLGESNKAIEYENQARIYKEKTLLKQLLIVFNIQPDLKCLKNEQ